MDNGHFNDSSYGVISVRSFSIFGNFKRRVTDFLWPEHKDYRYRSCLCYSTASRNRDTSEWNVYSVIIKDSDLYYKVNYI